MPSRTPKSGTWVTSDLIGASDLNKDPGGWVLANPIGVVDCFGPAISTNLVNTTFSHRNGRSYLIVVSLAAMFVTTGTAATQYNVYLEVAGVDVRGFGTTFPYAATGVATFGPTLAHKWDATFTGSSTLKVRVYNASSSTVRHDGGTAYQAGEYQVIDIGPSS